MAARIHSPAEVSVPASAATSAPCASARRLETLTSSTASDCARPRAVAIPTRRPVKVPGPAPTAIRSISRQPTPSSSSSSRAGPNSLVACPGCSPGRSAGGGAQRAGPLAGGAPRGGGRRELRSCARPPGAGRPRSTGWRCRGRGRSSGVWPREARDELLDLDQSAVCAAVAEGDLQAGAGQLGCALLRPLHERDATRPDVVLQQLRLLVLEAGETGIGRASCSERV